MTSEEIRVRSLLYMRTNQRELVDRINPLFSYAGLYPEIHTPITNEPIIHSKPNMDKLPGGWEFNDSIKLSDTIPHLTLHKCDTSLIFSLDNFISESDCTELIRLMKECKQEAPVSVQGMQDINDTRIGSVRATCWSETISKEIHRKLNKFLFVRTMNDKTSTDFWQGGENKNVWKPVGVSPLLRFMKYQKEGEHAAHYDCGFINDSYRTLMSFVIYLTTNEDGGSTRFVNDGQEHLPVWDRNHSDWSRPTREDEVFLKVGPVTGRILLFDHRICHDVEKYMGDNDRVIIRGDVMFKSY